MRPTIVIAIAVAGVVLIAFAVSRSRKDEDEASWRRDEDLASFAPALWAFDLERRSTRRNSVLWDLRGRDWTVKIDVLRDTDEASAEILRAEGRLGLEALYAEALSPYPGDISFKVASRPEYLPRSFERERDGVRYSWFLLYAGARLGYGAATPEAVRFKSLLGWFYCPSSRRFYKVRLFAPLDREDSRLEAFFLSLNCG